jgi:hypothetical protein
MKTTCWALRSAAAVEPAAFEPRQQPSLEPMLGLDHIAVPSSLDDGAAEALLRRVLVDAAMFELVGEGDGRRFAAR